jgi:hypothetical protein
MLTYYALTSWALFLGYWSRRWSFAGWWVVLTHLMIYWIWDTGASALPNDVVREAVGFRMLAIALTAFVGFMMAHVIELPESVDQPERGWLYDLQALFFMAVWVGTGFIWSYVPRAWWIYVFVVPIPQLLCFPASVWFMDHARVWGLPAALDVDLKTIFLVHWHFLVLWAMHTVTFVVGECIRTSEQQWPMLYVIVACSASALWIVFCSARRQAHVFTRFPTTEK